MVLILFDTLGGVSYVGLERWFSGCFGVGRWDVPIRAVTQKSSANEVSTSTYIMTLFRRPILATLQ